MILKLPVVFRLRKNCMHFINSSSKKYVNIVSFKTCHTFHPIKYGPPFVTSSLARSPSRLKSTLLFMKPLLHVTREVEVLWQVLKRAIVSKRASANKHSTLGGMVCVCGGRDLVTFAMSAFITTIAAKIKIKQTRSND